MATVFDYLKWRGDLSFSVSPFNIVDNLILAEIGYMDFNGLVSEDKIKFSKVGEMLEKKYEETQKTMGLIVPAKIIDLTIGCSKTKRFGDVYLSDYVDDLDVEESCQFSACTFILNKKQIYVCFRGTDDSFAGWDENLNMVKDFPVPAQKKSLEYLEIISKKFPNYEIFVGGQSKGGNLANFAGIYASDKVKKRITYVYSNDGPGFRAGVVDDEKFNSIKDRLILITPKESIVGSLFDFYVGKVLIVDSHNKGVFQHDSLSWLVNCNEFEYVKDFTKNSKALRQEITELINSLSEEERNSLSLDAYNFICSSNLTTLAEFSKDPWQALANLKSIKLKNRMLFTKFFYLFIKYRELGY